MSIYNDELISRMETGIRCMEQADEEVKNTVWYNRAIRQFEIILNMLQSDNADDE